MLDSDQEPSYNLSKNLLLLPRILKLIKDMVDDSTPLIIHRSQQTKDLKKRSRIKKQTKKQYKCFCLKSGSSLEQYLKNCI